MAQRLMTPLCHASLLAAALLAEGALANRVPQTVPDAATATHAPVTASTAARPDTPTQGVI